MCRNSKLGSMPEAIAQRFQRLFARLGTLATLRLYVRFLHLLKSCVGKVLHEL
jgi:hypothetical protein